MGWNPPVTCIRGACQLRGLAGPYTSLCGCVSAACWDSPLCSFQSNDCLTGRVSRIPAALPCVRAGDSGQKCSHLGCNIPSLLSEPLKRGGIAVIQADYRAVLPRRPSPQPPLSIIYQYQPAPPGWDIFRQKLSPAPALPESMSDMWWSMFMVLITQCESLLACHSTFSHCFGPGNSISSSILPLPWQLFDPKLVYSVLPQQQQSCRHQWLHTCWPSCSETVRCVVSMPTRWLQWNWQRDWFSFHIHSAEHLHFFGFGSLMTRVICILCLWGGCKLTKKWPRWVKTRRLNSRETAQ